MARAKSFHENQCSTCPQEMLFAKVFWQASMLTFSSPRRLHTAQIDVKLCDDVADDARRRSMSSEIKKKKN